MINSGQGQLHTFATLLADLDILKAEHLRGLIGQTSNIKGKTLVEVFAPRPKTPSPKPHPHPHTLSEAVELAIQHHINPTGDLFLGGTFSLNVRSDVGTDLGWSTAEHYQDHHKLKERVPVGALELNCRADHPHIVVIGKTLQKLERLHRGLGRTVLSVLDEALHSCCRGLTPLNGIHWASQAYWMGDEDEDQRIEDDMAQYEKGDPDRPTPENWNGFRRRDYEAAFPEWCVKPFTPLSRRKLSTLHHPSIHSVLAATLELMELGDHNARPELRDACDLGMIESGIFEVSPFLLRWSDSDPLPQIWDDLFNDHYQGGDASLELNAVWLWHDRDTLADAFNRIRNYLNLSILCNKLIRLL